MKNETRERRKLFQALGAWGAAVAVPDRWITPTVDFVVLPAHAQTTPRELNCEITRGEEGASPRVGGGSFVIDTVIEFFDAGISVGDTLDARHRVPAAGYDETFPSAVTEALGRFFGGSGVPFSVTPVPAGVAVGQDLVITVTMTSGGLAGASCTESLEIE